jgi:hypothetical protein
MAKAKAEAEAEAEAKGKGRRRLAVSPTRTGANKQAPGSQAGGRGVVDVLRGARAVCDGPSSVGRVRGGTTS